MPGGTAIRSNSHIQPSNISSKATNRSDAGAVLPFGGFSFESESLPDFSEFEGNTSGSDSQTERTRPTDGRMAPVTTIETVTISRPLKVIAFLCGLFASILLLMALASSEWLLSNGYKQGLIVYCVMKTEDGRSPTVPFAEENSEEADIGCHRINLAYQAYTLVAGAFCVSALLVNIFATLLIILGLRCRDANKKYKYYRISVIVMAIALVGALVALIVYPVCFSQIIKDTKRDEWEFGWAYGVGWGASIFLIGGILLLLCDKESEEIYYKERTIVHYADPHDKNSMTN